MIVERRKREKTPFPRGFGFPVCSMVWRREGSFARTICYAVVSSFSLLKSPKTQKELSFQDDLAFSSSTSFQQYSLNYHYYLFVEAQSMIYFYYDKI
jgi:hypothetical protein